MKAQGKYYTGGHETPNKSFLIPCLCYHKSAGLCYSPNCVINWFVSPNGPCNQGARVTTRPLLPNGLCHQTACVTRRPVSPSLNSLVFARLFREATGRRDDQGLRGAVVLVVVFARLFREEAGQRDDLRPSRAVRKKKNKLKFAWCSRGCFGKEVASYET